MTEEYYYLDVNRQTVGPVALAELKRLESLHQLSPDTFVFAWGAKDWQPWSEIKKTLPSEKPTTIPLPQPMTATTQDPPRTSSTSTIQKEKAAFGIGVTAICFSALGAAWSFLGGFCCGWAGWGWAFIGLVLSIVSLCFKRSNIGWTALALAIFSFAWVIVSFFLFTAQAANALSQTPHHY